MVLFILNSPVAKETFQSDNIQSINLDKCL